MMEQRTGQNLPRADQASEAQGQLTEAEPEPFDGRWLRSYLLWSTLIAPPGGTVLALAAWVVRGIYRGTDSLADLAAVPVVVVFNPVVVLMAYIYGFVPLVVNALIALAMACLVFRPAMRLLIAPAAGAFSVFLGFVTFDLLPWSYAMGLSFPEMTPALRIGGGISGPVMALVCAALAERGGRARAAGRAPSSEAGS